MASRENSLRLTKLVAIAAIRLEVGVLMPLHPIDNAADYSSWHHKPVNDGNHRSASNGSPEAVALRSSFAQLIQ